MQIKKSAGELSILAMILIVLAFAVVQRFDREVRELESARHPLETFHAR